MKYVKIVITGLPFGIVAMANGRKVFASQPDFVSDEGGVLVWLVDDEGEKA